MLLLKCLKSWNYSIWDHEFCTYKISLSAKWLQGILLLSFLFALGGCFTATPKIQLNTGDMVMEVKSKVPIIGTVAYAPDGKSVYSGGIDGTVRQWDLVGAREAKTYESSHKGWIDAVAFSPDGKTVAASSSHGVLNVSSNKEVTLWDTATGNAVREITGMGRQISFSPDGKLIIGDTGVVSNSVKVADARTGSIIKEFRGLRGTFSPDGKYILKREEKEIVLIDRLNGGELWRARVGTNSLFGAFAFSPDSKYILAAINDKANNFAPLLTSLRLLNTATGTQVREFGHSLHAAGITQESLEHFLVALAFSPDGRFAISGDSGRRYTLWDISSGTEMRQLKMVKEESSTGTVNSMTPAVAFSPDGKTAVVDSLASTRLFDVTTGDELGTMIAFEDGEWLVITPNGYYNSSEKGDQYLSVSVGGQPYSIAQFHESFFRPDLVQVALAGGSLREFRKMAEIKQPPAVSIIDTPGSVPTQETTITLKIADIGGGIGDIRLYLNGTAVVLDNSRGVAIVPAKDAGDLIKKYTVKLTSGVNTIRAIAFNGDNTMQSSDALHEITASYTAIAKPSLYAVVIGINEYTNPKLQLNYAVADAGLFADTLKKGAVPLFEKVIVKTLVTKEETTRENILRELRAMQSLNPDDLFVFYVASHGTVDDGEYFLITSNVGSLSTPKLKTDAISQNTLKDIVSNIPATKKLIVIDTCSAGRLGDAIQTAMLTRGMSEDTAMKVLSRAVGSTILSASTSVQDALEGYRGHGLFTYVVSEGLNGKADKSGSGFVRTTELADYVDNEVPVLAERIFKKPQYPTISISGMGFPIGKVQFK